ncbi:sensor histidine kinase [Nocardiopsis trehalosi]|uniref:sensor histidine kinase n=1 Tax=Nocardiopsis trehalosi TaxID=109329 RepID=UPI00083645E8|nr:histidine kinase [Nocardiopsis trehalosi]
MNGDADARTCAPPTPAPTTAPTAAATAAAALAVAVLTALTLAGHWSTPDPAWPLWADAAVGAAACLSVPLLLRRPAGTGLALTAAAALSGAATPAASLGALLTARRHPLPAAAALAAAGIAAHAAQGLPHPTGGITYGWWLLLVTAGYGALVGWGALDRTRHALIASLCERADRAEAEQGRRVAEARALERTRLAREMHDVLAHRLSLLATYAGALEYRPDAPPERLARAAGVVRAGVHEALEELRDVIAVLRDDDTPDGATAAHRPPPVLADLPDLVGQARAAGQRVDLDTALPATAAPPPGSGRAAYRVVQEALTNARKHAPGRPVRVAVAGGPGTGLDVDVRNPPPAPAAPAPPPGAGTGLIGLTERVRLAGGRLDHRLGADGFHLHARLPWPL